VICSLGVLPTNSRPAGSRSGNRTLAMRDRLWREPEPPARSCARPTMAAGDPPLSERDGAARCQSLRTRPDLHPEQVFVGAPSGTKSRAFAST
jgi:hypothetical protein